MRVSISVIRVPIFVRRSEMVVSNLVMRAGLRRRRKLCVVVLQRVVGNIQELQLLGRCVDPVEMPFAHIRHTSFIRIRQDGSVREYCIAAKPCFHDFARCPRGFFICIVSHGSGSSCLVLSVASPSSSSESCKSEIILLPPRYTCQLSCETRSAVHLCRYVCSQTRKHGYTYVVRSSMLNLGTAESFISCPAPLGERTPS